MTQLVLATRELAGRLDPVWMALAIGFAMLALFLPEQAYDTLTFTTDSDRCQYLLTVVHRRGCLR